MMMDIYVSFVDIRMTGIYASYIGIQVVGITVYDV